MKNLLDSLWSEESGQDLVEYGLLLALVAVVAVASLQTIANAITNVFSATAGNLTVS